MRTRPNQVGLSPKSSIVYLWRMLSQVDLRQRLSQIDLGRIKFAQAKAQAKSAIKSTKPRLKGQV